MQIKLNEGCKLFILEKNGIQEIDVEKVNVVFLDGIPKYFLKNGIGNEVIVQSLNKKFASKKMLEILIKKNKSNERNKPNN